LKLSIIIKSHSITSSEITIQSSSNVSLSISFISFNAIETNMLMKQTLNNIDSAAEAQTLKKLVKTCKFVYATSVFLQRTNEDLLLTVRCQHERFTCIKDHYVDARILNLNVIEKRNQKTEDKTQQKFNKQNDMLLNQ
jgi:hypothetical protein